MALGRLTEASARPDVAKGYSHPSVARAPVPGPVFKAVRTYWKTKPDRIKAFDVAWCESRFYVYARNGQFLGLFQMGEWARSMYGHGYNAMSQAAAAYRYWRVAGWTPWECA